MEGTTGSDGRHGRKWQKVNWILFYDLEKNKLVSRLIKLKPVKSKK